MKELSISYKFCPGINVCADKVCVKLLGASFYERLVIKNQRGLISEEKFSKEQDAIHELIIRCPAQAVSLKDCE